jgi:lipopolysaccharide biosynthesis protein
MKHRDQILLSEAYSKIIESMHGDNWQETSWEDTTNDGKLVKVTISDLFAFSKDMPISEINVDSLKPLALHQTKTDPETLANIQKANLDYPILILNKNNGKQSILDGHHRLQKAITNKIPKIKAKVLNISDMPEDWQWLFS